MTIDPRIPSMPGRSTSHFHQPGRREERGWGGEGGGCKVIGRGHRVPPAGLPIEQVLGEYSLSLPS